MKICFVINNINRGGAETMLLNLIKYLQQKDASLDIEVVILEDEQVLRPLFDEENIRVVLLPVLKKHPLSQLLSLYKYFRKSKPDVVHSHLLKADLVALPAAYFARVKKRYSTIHSMEESRNKRERVSRIMVNTFAQSIIMVSQSAQRHFEKNGEYKKSKMQVIYNAAGFHATHVDYRRSKGAPLNIVQVARLDEAKGQIYLLKAMKYFKDTKRSCHLTIFGEGNQRLLLESYMYENDLSNVTLAGITHDVKSELKKADLFVASSLWEGFHIALVEAIMMGVPVLATDIPPHREILCQKSEYQFLVRTEDDHALAKGIEMIMEMSDDSYGELSKQCLTLSEAFSITRMISGYYDLYRGC